MDPSPPAQVYYTEPLTSRLQPHSTVDNVKDSATPATAEEFTARMKAGFQNHDTAWLNSQGIDSGIVDPKIEAWDEWMKDW